MLPQLKGCHNLHVLKFLGIFHGGGKRKFERVRGNAGRGSEVSFYWDDMSPTIKKSSSNLLDQRTLNLSSSRGRGALMVISSPLLRGLGEKMHNPELLIFMITPFE
jgi:hypothetical protein